jgi:hypothetical protein
LWHIYYITVNQVLVATVRGKKFEDTKEVIRKLRSDGFTLITLGRVASLLAATLYQGKYDRMHKLWNIATTKRHIIHIQMPLENWYIQMEGSQWENWSHLLCHIDRFFTDPNCSLLGVGKGIKQMLLGVSVESFIVNITTSDWLDQHNHQVRNH